MVKYENIMEARETAEMLLNYWDRQENHEQMEYYQGCFNALSYVLDGLELFADDETAVLSEE